MVARRLARSRLDRRAPAEELVAVVRETCGVHAQLESGAELAISARVEGVTRDDVREALWESRALVKASTLRTTLHLHPADEIALWKSAYPPRASEAAWRKWQELTEDDVAQLRETVLAALDDGEPRTRNEIGAAVGGAFGARIAADSWGHLLAPSADLLCHGPPRGRNVTFVRCDRWIAGWRAVDPADGLVEASRRYLDAYGPARRDELEHWLARRLPDGAFAALELEEVDVDGRTSLALAGTELPDAAPSGVRLLSHYDVYVVGCHPRELLIPEERTRIFHGGAGPNPALLVNGVVAGTWRREKRGRRMEIRVEPFRRLTAAQRRALAAEAARVAAWYGADPVLELL